MKYCAIGVSFENQCTWSVELDLDLVHQKQEVIQAVADYAHCSTDDMDEVLVVIGWEVVHHWTKVKEDF